MIIENNPSIRLRDFALKDIESYTYWQTGPQEWKKFDGPYYAKEEKSAAEHAEFIQRQIDEQSRLSPRSQLVIADADSDRLIGFVSSYWISRETHWLAAGIVIYDPGFWSGGRGKAALSLWIEYLFQHRPEIVRLDLQTWSGNSRMMRLAQKLGFKEEGRFRMARIVDGEYFDSVHFGILRSEWESRFY